MPTLTKTRKKENLKINEHDIILLDDGNVGTVIHKYTIRKAFEVEFEDRIETIFMYQINRVLTKEQLEEIYNKDENK